MSSITLNLSSLVEKISDRDLEILSRDNPDTQIEINSEGQLIFMPPTGGETGDRNGELLFQVKLWNKKTQLGKVFDSSTGFKLSNHAVRSPDVSWITISQWEALTKEERKKYLPIPPDFLVELMSPTDILVQVQSKMVEYMNCGVRLGWLINPDAKQVEIYRRGKEIEVLNNPKILSGEEVMTGLVVSLAEIFDD